MKKLIVFDLDGTLVNTIFDIASSMNQALRENGFNEHSTEKYIEFIGEGVIKLTKKAIGCEVSDEVFSKVLNRYNEIYHNNLTNLSVPYDGMNEVLDELLLKGYKLAVISNKPDADTQEIVNHFYPNKFTYITGAKDNVLRKPSSMAMEILLEKMNLDIKEVSYVGDSRYDYLFANNCGCDCYLFTYGYEKKDMLFNYKPKAFLYKSTDLLEYF